MSTCPRCFEDTGCTCEEHDRIAELEAINQTLHNDCFQLRGENSQLKKALQRIANAMKHPHDHLDWEVVEMAVQAITPDKADCATKDGSAPDECSCSVTNTSTSADLQVSITDRECLCGEINGRHCPIHQEPSCPIHGTEKMVDGVCHGTHVREGSTELNGDSE